MTGRGIRAAAAQGKTEAAQDAADKPGEARNALDNARERSESLQKHQFNTEGSGTPCSSVNCGEPLSRVYADVELWLDRELWETLDELRPGVTSRERPINVESSQSKAVKMGSARRWPILPYPTLDTLRLPNAGPCSKSSNATKTLRINSQEKARATVDSKTTSLGSPEPEHPRVNLKRRRTATPLPSRDQLATYLETKLDELERDIDIETANESVAEVGTTAIPIQAPSMPSEKASRRMASSEGDETVQREVTAHSNSIHEALRRMYHELRQRVRAQKYDTVESFVADLSLLLSDLGRSKSGQASPRVAIRRRTDLIRQRVDVLLQSSESNRRRTGTGGESSASTTPHPTTPLPKSLTAYWHWLQEQFASDFGSREALGAVLISQTLQDNGSAEDIAPEFSRAALISDLHGIIRPPIGSILGLSGTFAINDPVPGSTMLPKAFLDQIQRIYQLREHNRFLQDSVAWISQQAMESPVSIEQTPGIVLDRRQQGDSEWPSSNRAPDHETRNEKAQRNPSDEPLNPPHDRSDEALPYHRVELVAGSHPGPRSVTSVFDEAEMSLAGQQMSIRPPPLFIETIFGAEDPNSKVSLLGRDKEGCARHTGSSHEHDPLVNSWNDPVTSPSTERFHKTQTRPAELVQVDLPLPMFALQRAVAAVLVLSGYTTIHRSVLEAMTEITADLLGRLGRQLSWLRYQSHPAIVVDNQRHQFGTASKPTTNAARQGKSHSERAHWQQPRDYLHHSRCDLLYAPAFSPLRYLAETISRCGIRDGFNGLMRYGRFELPAMGQMLAESESLMASKLMETKQAQLRLESQMSKLGPSTANTRNDDRLGKRSAAVSPYPPVDIDPQLNATFRLFGVVNESITLDVLQLEQQGVDAVALPYSLAQRVASQLEEQQETPPNSSPSFQPVVKVVVSRPWGTRRRP